jgi:hypothetical protein
MDWKALGESLAKLGLPLLGAVLPIPGGAAIGTALASALGAKSADPQDILTALTASADAQLKAQQFEATHQEAMLGLQLKFETDQYAASVADRSSARDMQVSTKAFTVPTLAFVIVGAFIAMVVGTLLGYAKVDSVLAGTLVGYLSAKCEQVIAFYFGSSQGSQAKDVLLAQSTPIKKG